MHYSSSLLAALSAVTAVSAIPANIPRDIPRFKGGKPLEIHPNYVSAYPNSTVATASHTSPVLPSWTGSQYESHNGTAINITDITQGVTFSVTQVPSKVVPKNGARALVNAHMKHRRSIPTWLRTSVVKGSVVATPESYDYEYICPITVGGQSLNMDFDTGSADL